ncbi:cytochrome P450 [Streptomyces sp. 4N509B]|uniref:cytochrome P450 n=1 Tax=Streptomyces sp. 4N509B TaxID=3457413 RepID=UPI003FD06E03
MDTVDSLPMAPGTVPLLGHAIPIFRDPLGFVTSLRTHGDLVRIRMGSSTVVVVCDPELTHQVLVDDRTFDKGGPLYERIFEWSGDNLGSCPYHRHRRQRRLCQPAFHPDRFPAYGAVAAETAREMVASWREGQSLDVSAEMAAATLRIAVRTMFASALPGRVVQELADDSAAILGSAFRQMVMPRLISRLPTPGNRQLDRAHRRLRHTIGRIIAERRARDAEHGDLLSSLMAAVDPDSPTGTDTLSDQELSNQIIGFIIAGTETTAGTLIWALHLLAEHPDVEAALHREVDGVLAGGPPSYEVLPKLELASRVVTETLRLYPPAWLVTRLVTRDTVLGGVTLPGGTSVAYSAHLVHHRPDVYDEPERFEPDRWTGRGPDRRSYLPFGDGARKCIGYRFAMVEVVLALAAITSRWRLVPITGFPTRPSPLNLPAPRGLRMRLVPRP